MKKRQDKANEIRDLVKRINARIAELEEDGYTVQFSGQNWRGKINNVTIERTSKL